MDNSSRRGIFRKAHVSIGLVQLFLGGYTVVSKVALNGGINQLVFGTYYNVLAFLILAPIAYFYEKRTRPPITRDLLVSFFFLGVTGIFGTQLLFLAGLTFTNPTYAAAMQPTIPILTFVLALIMGLETLNLLKLESKLKVGGILVCVAGALLMVLLQGPAVIGSSELGNYSAQGDSSPATATSGWLMSTLIGFGLDRWQIGVICLVGQCISLATFITLQGRTLAKYPAILSVTAYSYFFGLVLIIIAGLLSTSYTTDWSLTWSELLAVLYAGIISSALTYVLAAWSNKILGPVIVSLYNPLQPVASTLLSTIFLRSPIYLGSIIGGIIIIGGLYIVTWASYKERQAMHNGAIITGVAPYHVAYEVSEPLIDKDSTTTSSLTIIS